MKVNYEVQGESISVNNHTLAEVIEQVGAEKVHKLITDHVAYHTIASKIKSIKSADDFDPDEDDAVPLEWDLIEVMNNIGTRRSKYPVPSKFMESARTALVAKGKIAKDTKLKDFGQDGDDFAKIVTVASHLYKLEQEAKKGLDDLIG